MQTGSLWPPAQIVITLLLPCVAASVAISHKIIQPLKKSSHATLHHWLLQHWINSAEITQHIHNRLIFHILLFNLMVQLLCYGAEGNWETDLISRATLNSAVGSGLTLLSLWEGKNKQPNKVDIDILHK